MERQRMFARRIGKVLAASRAVLAAVFILALWLDPGQPVRADVLGYLVLSLYMAWATALMIVAWTSWWYEFRLAPLAHCIDVLAFVAGVYYTETGHGDFSSPFMAFTAYLLISATLRWGWSAVAWTAAMLVLLNGTAGSTLYALHEGIDPYRFGRRMMYMVVLSMMMVWLSAQPRTTRAIPIPKVRGTPGERRTALQTEMLTLARTSLGGSGGAIATARGEEPWTDVVRDTGGAVVHDRLGPDALEGSVGEPGHAALIDRGRNRRLVTRTGTFPVALHGPFAAPLAAHCGVDEGIIVTFETASGPGQLLIWGIPDMCIDDLPVVEEMARHLSLELDREDMAEMAQAASAAALRDALARDLHDSVAQFLAGTLFRLQALARWIREGHDPISEIYDIKDALRREQAELRAMISRLRRGEEADRHSDLVEELEPLLGELSHHWQIAVKLDAPARPLPVSISLAYELRQVLREAIANAARHGRCQRVVVTVACEGSQIVLRIADDGAGFTQEAAELRPRSISERVEALGGTLNICNNEPGVLLEIELPARIAA